MKNCIFCQKDTKNPKFCSRSCAAKYNNTLFPKRKTKKKCINCNEIVKSYRHSRCEKHHKEYIKTKFNYLKELPLKEYWNRESLKNLHQSSKNAYIRVFARSHFKDLIAKPCANCGYNKHVELCHIKPLKDFDENVKLSEVNSYENLVQLCPNCHWELDHKLIKIEDIRIKEGEVGIEPT